ncbi:MAG: ABC transporter substrate-binding protein [Gemmatimonadaceae bacterium]
MKRKSLTSRLRSGAHSLALAFLISNATACGADRQSRNHSTLVAAISNDPGHLNTAITTNGSVHSAAGLLYNGLVSLDANLEPVPDLAERWEVENGGTLYRFHLRRDVRWHDGKPFTAADVKFTFEELLVKFHARTRASVGPALLRVDAPDDSTVEFRFRRPYAALLQQLDVDEAPIMPKHLFAGSDPLKNPANSAPVGTGPFRFVSYRSGSEIRYAANKEYFRGAPALQSVVMRIVPDAGTQLIALEAGEVDWLFGVPGPERARLRTNPRFRLIQTRGVSGGSNCVSTLGFNLDRPLFRDIRLRRAIARALDRRQFLERVAFGEGRVADAPISSGISFAHASGLAMAGFDTVEAGRLLDSAGWLRGGGGVRRARGVGGFPDGAPLVIGFSAMPGQGTYGDLIRAQLRTAGIDVRVELLEPAVFGQKIFTARDFDTAVVSYCNGSDPEIGVRRQYVSTNIAPVPFSNLAAYRNAVMDSLFDHAASALDVGERRRVYRQIQEIAVRDQPYVWLIETLSTYAHNVRCRGLATSSHFAASATCTR